MNYQNPFINPYGMAPQYPQMPAAPQQVVRVNGENGARAYNLGANSSILLLDETEPIVWLKVTDGASYPTITPYKIEPLERQKPQNDEITALAERISKIEEAVFKKPQAIALGYFDGGHRGHAALLEKTVSGSILWKKK